MGGGVTPREMTEAIAKNMREIHHVEIDPEAIWNVHPTGELWPVFALYDMYVHRQGLDDSLIRYVHKLVSNGRRIGDPPGGEAAK